MRAPGGAADRAALFVAKLRAMRQRTEGARHFLTIDAPSAIAAAPHEDALTVLARCGTQCGGAEGPEGDDDEHGAPVVPWASAMAMRAAGIEEQARRARERAAITKEDARASSSSRASSSAFRARASTRQLARSLRTLSAPSSRGGAVASKRVARAVLRSGYYDDALDAGGGADGGGESESDSDDYYGDGDDSDGEYSDSYSGNSWSDDGEDTKGGKRVRPRVRRVTVEVVGLLVSGRSSPAIVSARASRATFGDEGDRPSSARASRASVGDEGGRPGGARTSRRSARMSGASGNARGDYYRQCAAAAADHATTETEGHDRRGSSESSSVSSSVSSVHFLARGATTTTDCDARRSNVSSSSVSSSVSSDRFLAASDMRCFFFMHACPVNDAMFRVGSR